MINGNDSMMPLLPRTGLKICYTLLHYAIIYPKTAFFHLKAVTLGTLTVTLIGSVSPIFCKPPSPETCQSQATQASLASAFHGSPEPQPEPIEA